MTFIQLTILFHDFFASPQFLIVASVILSAAILVFAFFYTGLHKIIPCKTRYILTRQNRLRLRYVAVGFAGFALVVALNWPSALRLDYTAGPAEIAGVEPAAGAAQDMAAYEDGTARKINQASLTKTAIADNHATSKGPINVSVEVGRGDTFTGVLTDAGVTADDAHNVVEAVSEHFNMKKLHAGQKLDLRLEPDASGANMALSKVAFKIDPLKTLHIERDASGELNSRVDEKAVQATRHAARIVIDGSLYGSAEKANLPDTVTANAIKMFSYAVDFQRDIKQGDKLEVLYNTMETKEGYIAKTGDIIHARMVIGGKEFSLYQFKGKDGSVDYYTADGKSIRKSAGGIMKTPVAFGRVSSGYGMREHPILGYTKMHKGIDFAAPIGTAVYAAADGQIEKAGLFSSYGNYVKIRHNSKMETAYAHLSRFAAGIHPGSRVHQGQVVAYVGMTGRSTGPHLHFEVLANGIQVNPRSVKIASDDALKGQDLNRFKAMVRSMDQEYVRKASSTSLASARGVNVGEIE